MGDLLTCSGGRWVLRLVCGLAAAGCFVEDETLAGSHAEPALPCDAGCPICEAGRTEPDVPATRCDAACPRLVDAYDRACDVPGPFDVVVPDVACPEVPDVACPDAPAIPDATCAAVPDVPCPEAPDVPCPEAPDVACPAIPDVPCPEAPDVLCPSCDAAAPPCDIQCPGCDAACPGGGNGAGADAPAPPIEPCTPAILFDADSLTKWKPSTCEGPPPSVVAKCSIVASGLHAVLHSTATVPQSPPAKDIPGCHAICETAAEAAFGPAIMAFDGGEGVLAVRLTVNGTGSLQGPLNLYYGTPGSYAKRRWLRLVPDGGGVPKGKLLERRFLPEEAEAPKPPEPLDSGSIQLQLAREWYTGGADVVLHEVAYYPQSCKCSSDAGCHDTQSCDVVAGIGLCADACEECCQKCGCDP